MAQWEFRMMKKEMKEKPKQKSNWRRVTSLYWDHAKKYKWAFFLVIFAYSLGGLIDATVVPYVYRAIIDGISNFAAQNGSLLPATDSAFGKEIFGYVGIIAGIFLLNRVLYTVADYAIAFFQSRVIRDLTNFAFKKTVDHSYQFFINSFAGSLVKKVGRFVHSFEEIHDVLTFSIMIPGVRLVSVFIVLFIVAPVIGYLYLMWALIFVILSFHFAKKRVIFDVAEAAADSRTTGRTADVFTNVLNLKMFSSSHREERSYNEVTTEQMHARDRAWGYQNFTFLLQGSVVTWLQIVSLSVSITLWFQGSITLGTIVLAYSYSATIFESVWNLGKQMSRMSKAFSNASEMVEIIDSEAEIMDPAAPVKPAIKSGEIIFDDVVFAYKQGVPVLNRFNLKITPGEKVGIIGTSGAGKTTITKLLLRFADVTGGSIRIDGQDVRSLKQDDLRMAIAYVPQDPILFHRSLSENISYGKTKAKQGEIEDAAKLAHAHDFIQTLHHGYDTMVGERGVKLSGGERQRVAIARAILKNAPILILDEATSSLDSVSETHIKEALDVLMQGRTTIVIAHRLSTIEKMDRIIVMEKGEIVEEGSHKELLGKKGIYHNFWTHQNQGFIK